MHFVNTTIRFLSESPRWLISKGRVNEAQKVIRKIARINQKDIPDEFFDGLELKKQDVRIYILNIIVLFKLPQKYI